MTPPSPPRTVDLNCDLGESPDRIRDGSDFALLDLITSANIACGGHAGDEFTMTELVRAAAARGIAIGAHPSYPDPANFGRVRLDIPADQLERSLIHQLSTLARIAAAHNTPVAHIKPHGALYHAASTDIPTATAIARAAAHLSPRPILIAQDNSPALSLWQQLGFPTAPEAFADRRYEPDGSLRNRSRPGAVLSNPAEAAAQAIQIASTASVLASDGRPIPIHASTLCIHSDSPGAPAIASAVRDALLGAGITLAPLTSPSRPRPAV